jgi:hypothetical protein
MRVERTFGGRAWLRSPFDGVQVGLSLLVMSEDDWSVEEDPGYAHSPGIAVQLRRGRFDGNAEVLGVDFEHGKLLGYYAQVGATLTEQLRLVAQFESSHWTAKVPFPMPEQEYWRDRIVGLNYTVNPNVVVKLEGHWTRGWGFDSYVPVEGPPGKTRFGIASISVSF